jgi:uncharacterized protein (TIGR03437 family)
MTDKPHLLFRFAPVLLMFPLLVTWAPASWSQTPRVRTEVFARGFSQPVALTHAGDGTKRMFVVEQRGLIRILSAAGEISDRPFLDISGRVVSGGERGLLGLAFPPNYRETGRFYVNYTTGSPLRTNISEFRVTNDRNVADPASERILLSFSQPFDNHNGGHLEFSPKDGFLYVAVGDGGSGGDPQNNSQNKTNLLGKILRLAVTGDLIPATNPFVADRSGRGEIWSYGLRNPWKFAFDRAGNMFIGDVGQNAREEVNFQPSNSLGGENYGWRLKEGSLCFNPDRNCELTAVVDPIFEYNRSEGVSITGGRVYQGQNLPSARGVYFVADFGSGNLWTVRNLGGQWRSTLEVDTNIAISTFGEDEDGELFFADYGGQIRRVLPNLKPEFLATGVVNGGSFQEIVTPGSIATLFGIGVTRQTGIQLTSRVGNRVEDSVTGVRVLVNDRAAPLFAVADTNGLQQINFQVPWETTGTTATVVVENNGVRSDPVTVRVGVNPGLFLQSDNLVAANYFDIAGQPANQGIIGGTAVLYGTGLGAVAATPDTGTFAPSASRISGDTQVLLNGTPATVEYAGLAPGFVGLYQINIRIPNSVTGEVDVTVIAGGNRSRSGRMRIR